MAATSTTPTVRIASGPSPALASKTPGNRTKKSGRKAGSTRIRESVFERTTKSPIHTRPRLSEKYEGPITQREDWWRSTIRGVFALAQRATIGMNTETPIPGSYEHQDFLYDIEKKPHSYRFKSDGRKIDPDPHGKGAVLLPGAYEHQDFLYRLDQFNTRYGFKNTGRDAMDFLNFGKKDKDINVCPTTYAMEDYLTLTTEKQPSRHWVFKSQSQRFPTIHFCPKDGPAPGNYEYKVPKALHAVSSSFKSKTPRFSSSHTKVPGPGSYEKVFQSPMPPTISTMGRSHGIFFSSAFQA